MTSQKGLPKELIGAEVVLDTNGQYLYIGVLVSVNEQFFTLEEADVHDRNESSTPKEIYIMDARKYGIKKNRRKVHVLASQVISLSKLEDVLEY